MIRVFFLFLLVSAAVLADDPKKLVEMQCSAMKLAASTRNVKVFEQLVKIDAELPKNEKESYTKLLGILGRMQHSLLQAEYVSGDTIMGVFEGHYRPEFFSAFMEKVSSKHVLF